jgi:hypothetical protein
MCSKRLSYLLSSFIALTVGCQRPAIEVRELRRLPSPNQALDLILTETPTGATVSTPYEVFVVAHGKAPTQEYEVFRIDKSSEPRIAWLNSAAAAITCESGRVWHFQNFASVRDAKNEFVWISVALGCGEHGYAAR